MKKLVKELVKKKPRGTHIQVIMSFKEDILRYLDEEEEEDYETNQYLIGIK